MRTALAALAAVAVAIEFGEFQTLKTLALQQ